eukprot:scaffold75497_cov33-Tisochrysis_lutea.AAC.4
MRFKDRGGPYVEHEVALVKHRVAKHEHDVGPLGYEQRELARARVVGERHPFDGRVVDHHRLSVGGDEVGTKQEDVLHNQRLEGRLVAGRCDTHTVANVIWARDVGEEEGGHHICGQTTSEGADDEQGGADGQEPRQKVDAPKHEQHGQENDGPDALQTMEQEGMQPIERGDRRRD